MTVMAVSRMLPMKEMMSKGGLEMNAMSVKILSTGELKAPHACECAHC